MVGISEAAGVVEQGTDTGSRQSGTCPAPALVVVKELGYSPHRRAQRVGGTKAMFCLNIQCSLWLNPVMGAETGYSSVAAAKWWPPLVARRPTHRITPPPPATPHQQNL